MSDDDALLKSCTRALSDTVDGVLFDLDGVVYRGENPIEHAIEAINFLPVGTGYVTNNAARTPKDVETHLRELGLDVDAEQITTSAQAAAAFVLSQYGTGTKVLMIGGAGLRHALEELPLTLVRSADDDPRVVVQGTARDLTWTDLAEGVYAINRGADHIATNLDSTMPTERGIALGNGALVTAIAHATGVKPLRSAGKPDPQIFVEAAHRSAMATPLIVGDRLDTDIKGARAAQMQSLVVLTGVVSGRDILASDPDERPHYLGHDLRALHEPHPRVYPSDDGWTCRDSFARVKNGDVIVYTGGTEQVLTGTGAAVEITLDDLRAACGAAWSATNRFPFDREIHIQPMS